MSDFETKYDIYYKAALDLYSQPESVEDVYHYIDSIEDDDDYRDVTLSRFGRFLAREGRLSEAVRFCAAISNPLERADSFYRLAVELKEQNLFDSAKDILHKAVKSAEDVECPYDRADVLLEVGDQFLSLGDRKKGLNLLRSAVEFAGQAPQNFEANKTIRGCARALAKWNYIPEAIQVAQEIDDRWAALREAALEEVQGRGQWPVHPAGEQ